MAHFCLKANAQCGKLQAVFSIKIPVVRIQNCQGINHFSESSSSLSLWHSAYLLEMQPKMQPSALRLEIRSRCRWSVIATWTPIVTVNWYYFFCTFARAGHRQTTANDKTVTPLHLTLEQWKTCIFTCFSTYQAIQPSLHLNTNYKNQQEATAKTMSNILFLRIYKWHTKLTLSYQS